MPEQYQPVDGDPFAASAVSLQPVEGDPFAAGSVNPQTTPQGSMPYDLQGQSIAAYNPTWREKAAQWLYGDQPRSPEAQATIRGLVGTTGLGQPQMSVSDLTPAGGVFGAQEAARRGDYSGAGIAAMSVLPGAGVIDRGAMDAAGAVEQGITRAWRGMPGESGTAPFLPSERGRFGPGYYASAQQGVAQNYGNTLPVDIHGDLFNAMPAWNSLTPEAESKVLSQLPAEQQKAMQGWKSYYQTNGEDFWEALRRGAGSDEAAQKAIQGAGYTGIQGIGDGHEIVAFDPQHITHAATGGAGEAVLGSGPIRNAAEKLEPVTGDPFTPITAYHASPYNFDQFDMSHIGEGEGAQAYGHGLYFAENEDTMDQYYKFFASKGSDWDDPHNVAAFWTNHFGGDRDQAIKYLSSPALKGSGTGALDLLKSGEPLNPTAGSSPTRYQVQINADPNHFLDWDKPLSEQPHIMANANQTGYPVGSGNQPGEDYYRQLGIHQLMEGKIPPNDRAAQYSSAADALRQAGIPGIKYLDAGSRNLNPFSVRQEGDQFYAASQALNHESPPFGSRAEAQDWISKNSPQGTSNYVVFDDKTIQILKKYGIGGLGIGTAAGLSHFKTQPVNGDPYQ